MKPDETLDTDIRNEIFPHEATRVYFMDSLRAVLMSLGVALHAAMVYDTSRKWVISDPSGDPAYGMLVSLIHLHRMPIFFLVAGFFTFLVYTKYSKADFLYTRVARIVFPFVATLLTANAALQWYFSEYGLRTFTIAHWVGHLWFLAYLFLYIVFFMGLYSIRGWLRLPVALIERGCEGRFRWLVLYMSFIAAFVVLRQIIKVLNLWETTIAGFIDVPELLQYFVYFVVGLLLRRSETVFKMFTHPPGWVALLAVALTVAVIGAKHFAVAAQYLDRWITLVELSATFFGASLVLGVFRRYFNVDSRMTRYFSDASFSIYLFHGPFLIAFATVLVSLDLPGWVKFLLLVTLCLACTLAVHALAISRVPFLMLLFNGKRISSRQRRFSDQMW